MRTTTALVLAALPALLSPLSGCATTARTPAERDLLPLVESDTAAPTADESSTTDLGRVAVAEAAVATDGVEASTSGLGDIESPMSAPPPQEVDNRYGPSRGDWEVFLSGSGSNDNDFETGGFTLSGSVGKYLSENFELSVRQSFSYADFGNSAWSGSTRAAADYHFDLDRVWPFVGVNVGGVYGDTVDDTFEAAPEAGVKWFVKEEVFLLGLVEYQFFFEETEEIDNGFEDGQFVYTVGFGVLF